MDHDPIQHTMITWKNATLVLTSMALATIAGLSSCGKTEQQQPSADQSADLTKSAGDVFIRTIPASNLKFALCGMGQQFTTDGVGTVRYGCSTPCTSAQVNVRTGVGSSSACLNEGMVYRIKATTGPSSRPTLVVTFPAGYDECSSNITWFYYDVATGTWSAPPGLFGVTWSQTIGLCP